MATPALGRRAVTPTIAPSHVRTFGKALVLASAAVMVLHVLAVLGRAELRPEDGVLAEALVLLDAGQERSLAAWWTAALLVLASVGAALVAMLAVSAGMPTRQKLAWSVLAVVFALLSLDEIVSLHERGAQWTASALDSDSALRKFGWLIPAGAILVLSLVVLVPALRAVPGRPRMVIVAGLATSVAGAMGMELAHVLLHDAGARLRWLHLVMAVEEAAEMTGVLIVLAGIAMAVSIVRVDGSVMFAYRRAWPDGRDDATLIM